LVDYRDTEHPWNHLLQGMMPVLFIAVWGIDSFLLRASTFLSEEIGLGVRLAVAIPFLVAAIYLMNTAHQMVFGDPAQTRKVIDTGIYGRVRHPMYLGGLLVYVFFILTTLSIISLVTWIGICIVVDRMAAFEEEFLLKSLGRDYAAYMKRVPRWLPRMRKAGPTRA
jgi:protein-S-isoprenylcysteine O-methyltransferase Ste14